MGIIKILKVKYRSKVLLKYADTIDSNDPVSINLLDALQFAKIAWSEVTKETITNCFRKAGFVHQVSSDLEEECTGDDEDESVLAELWTRCDGATPNVSLDDYLTADDGVCTSGELMDSDIVHEVCSMFGASTTEEKRVKKRRRKIVVRSISSQPFRNYAMDTLRRYFYGADIQDDGIFQKLDDIERTLVIAMTKSKKQASITYYFTPMQ